jgi:hypothetical protein
MITAEVREELKKFALDHYEEGGWDFLIETYEDREIDEELELAGITTLTAAKKHFQDVLGIHDERRTASMMEARW